MKKGYLAVGIVLVALGLCLSFVSFQTILELLSVTPTLNCPRCQELFARPVLESCAGILITIIGCWLSIIEARRSEVTAPQVVFPVTISDPRIVENARIGYHAAIDVWNTEVALGWSRFSGFMVANSIVVSAVAVMARDGPPFPLWTKALPLVGILICLAGVSILHRGFRYTDYWMNAALEIEDNFLEPLKLVKNRISFVAGEPFRPNIYKSKPVRMGWLGCRARARYVSYFMIVVFLVVYVLVFVQLMIPPG